MRIERKALTAAATCRKEENTGSQAVAGPGSERNQFSPEQGLPERALADHSSADHASSDHTSNDQASAEQARVSWLAAAAIQNAIANGTYDVSPEQTAEAILSEQQVRDESAA